MIKSIPSSLALAPTAALAVLRTLACLSTSTTAVAVGLGIAGTLATGSTLAVVGAFALGLTAAILVALDAFHSCLTNLNRVAIKALSVYINTHLLNQKTENC